MLFAEFEKETPDIEFLKDTKIPETFTSWCLRLELDKTKLFINSISM